MKKKTTNNKLRVLKEINVDIYNNSVILCFNVSAKAFRDFVKRREPGVSDRDIDINENDFCHGCGAQGKTFQFGGGKVMIQMPRVPKKGDDVLAHEISHAAIYILGFAGVKIVVDNDEPLAYLIGYLTREINQCL